MLMAALFLTAGMATAQGADYDVATNGNLGAAGTPIIPPSDLHFVSHGGAEFFIAINGSDSNNGSIHSPWKTLTYAVTKIKGGDAIFFRAGTYSGTGYSIGAGSFPSGTSWSNATTLSAYNGEAVILKPSGEPASPGGYSMCGIGLNAVQYGKIADQYMLFKDFTLDGSNGSSQANGFYFLGRTKSTDTIAETNHVRLQNVVIKNAQALGLQGGGYAHEFINVTIEDAGYGLARDPAIRNGGHGIYWWGHNTLFDGMDVFGSADQGMQLNNSEPNMAVEGNIIRNSRIHDNGGLAKGRLPGFQTMPGHSDSGGGMPLDVNNSLIYNNLIYNNVGGGMNLGYGDSGNNNMVFNNVIYGQSGTGLSIGNFGSGGNNNYIANNIIFKNANSDLKNNGSGNKLATNIIGSDPGFVNPGAGDFRIALQSSSAVDKGTALGEVQFDFDRKKRPIGAAYDIGAYEYDSPQAEADPAAKSSTRN